MMKANLININKLRVNLTALAVAGLVAISPLSAFAHKDDDTKKEVAKQGNVSIRQIGELKIRVALAQPVAEKVTVAIRNGASNEALYFGTLPTTGKQAQLFDLSQLSDGTYFFEVNTGKEKLTQSFDIKTKISRVVLVAGK